MSGVKLGADSGGGSVELKAPTSTTGNANLSYSLPDGTTGGVIKTSTYPSSLQILEQFWLVADGGSVTTSKGTVTSTNVTGNQSITTTHAEITGSSLTYTPPTGTTLVIYEYDALVSNDDQARFLLHYKLQIDGTDVTDSRDICYLEANDYQYHLNFKYPIHIGGSADTDTGRQASWTSNKVLRIMGREWDSDYDAIMHKLGYWDGGTPAITRKPRVGITAIGAH